MIRRLFRKLFRLAVVFGAAAAVYKVVQARRPSPDLPVGDAWPPPAPKPPPPPKPAQSQPQPPSQPKPPPAAPKAPAAQPAPAKAAPAAWVEPVDGACPPTHPVKAKLSSSIYHLPGMVAYERTNPDRCYRDEKSAQADGLRKAKR